MKTFLLILISLTITNVKAQIVDIPDPFFKNALLDHSTVIDINGDGEIQFSEAEAVTQLQVNNKDIIDLTGIEAFINLTDLKVAGNILTSVDFSQNTMLQDLDVSQNLLTELNLMQHEMLEILDFRFNEINSIEISSALNLKELYGTQNFLTSLNLNSNTNLERIVINRNNVSQINFTNQLILQLLELKENEITYLDLSQNTVLKELDISYNSLSSIDVANNSELRAFRMTNNGLLSEVDLSNNPNLCQVWLSYNDALTYINLHNGNNELLDSSSACNTTVGITTSGASLIQNPVLETVCVDDILFAEEHFDISFPVDFIDDCDLGIVEETIPSVQLFPNPVTSEVTIKSQLTIENVAIYNLLGQQLLLNKTSSSEEKLDLSQLSSGTYLVNVQSAKGGSVFRIIKE